MVSCADRPRSQQLRARPGQKPPGLGTLLRTTPVELLSPAGRAQRTAPGCDLLPGSLTASAGALPLRSLRPQTELLGRSQSSGRGLATPTRLQKTLNLQSNPRPAGWSADSNAGMVGTRPDAEEAEAADVLNEEAFADNVANLSQAIEEISRSLRLDHLQGKSDAKAAAREAARREKEAELRRARKKEQMAKDPRRKVALRIERGRREAELENHKAADDKTPAARKSSKSKAIPMVDFFAPECGLDNKEPVEVVDVVKIQRKCHGLGHHQTVHEMLEVRRRADNKKSGKGSATTSSHAGSSFEFGASLFSSSVLGSVPLEEKMANAKARRDKQRAQKIREKLLNMRSECPLYLCRAYGIVDQHGNSLMTGSLSDCDSDSSFSDEASVRQESNEASFRKAAFRRASRWVRGSPPEKTGGRRSSQQRRTSSGNNDQAKLKAMAAKMRTCRAILKAGVQWLKIFFHRRRRNRSADICMGLLRQLGEWVRMRSALKQFVANVKTIQKTIRSYLSVKRRRCHLIEKEWLRIEDSLLSVHAQHKAHMAMKEKHSNQSRSRAKRRLLSAALEASAGNKWKRVVDISSQRIPAAERKAIIERYHRRAIKRHMHIGKTFLELVFEALKASRDLDSFLSEFNYGTGGQLAVETFKVLEVKKEDLSFEHQQDQDKMYWQMSEAVIVQLVACSAQALAHTPHFKDHPATQAIPDEKRNVWPDYVAGSGPHEFAEFILLQLDRPCFRGRLGRSPGMRESDILAEEALRNDRKLQEGKFRQSRFQTSGSKKFDRSDTSEAPPPQQIRDVDEALMYFAPLRSKESDKELRRADTELSEGDGADSPAPEEDSVSPRGWVPEGSQSTMSLL